MNQSARERVLAVDLHPSSYGFALFEGADELLDWGIKASRHGGKPVKVPLDVKLGLLLDQYVPEVLIIRKPMTLNQREYARTVKALARARGMHCVLISEAAVREAFLESNRSKYQIATMIAARYPVLSSRLAEKRKVWESEKYSMSFFAAAAIGVAYFRRGATTSDIDDGAFSPLPR